MSMLSLRPGNFAPIVGIAYAQRNGYQSHGPATLEKMLDLLRSYLRPARRIHCFSRGSR